MLLLFLMFYCDYHVIPYDEHLLGHQNSKVKFKTCPWTTTPALLGHEADCPKRFFVSLLQKIDFTDLQM